MRKFVQIIVVWIAYELILYARGNFSATHPQVTPSPQAVSQSASPSLNAGSPSAELYTVTKVVDGDTIKVELASISATVRLIGIDTPEIVDPRKPVQCFAKEASAELHRLLDGKNVRLEADSTQDDLDKYKRLLRYIYLDDGTFINKHMVEQGFAHEYTYDVPYQFQAEFKDAQKDAMENKRGLWGEGVCGR